MKRIQKPIPPHSNFMALLYIWGVTLLLIGGIVAFVYWML